MSYRDIFKSPLKNRVAVYVPGTVDATNNDSETAARFTEQAAAKLSELFGGATISLAAGAWMSEEHGLIREDVNIVYSFCTSEQLDENAGEVLKLAEQIKKEMRQEAVSVEINNELYFI